jgi:hypothetical protein
MLAWTVRVWIVLLAVAAGLALYAVAVGVWGVGRMLRAGWRRARGWVGVSRPHSLTAVSSDPDTLPEPHTPAQARPRPSWARTEQDAA